MARTKEDHCNFCGRGRSEVNLLISGINGFICDQCAEQAKMILDEYYAPEDCLDTGLYNINNSFTQKPYKNKDQLSSIFATTDEITENLTTNRAKFKAIHDWMGENIEYDLDESYTGYPYDDRANPFTVFSTLMIWQTTTLDLAS